MIKQDVHIIKGINNDLSVSKSSNEFAFDAYNIRITAREDSSLLSITNEKGNSHIENVVINGTIIGCCVLNNYIILFSTGATDSIYRIEDKNDEFVSTLLYSGHLNFNTEYPIECIGIYENENIQKVYWIDGLNPIRFINIMNLYTNVDVYDDTIFNNVPKLSLNEKVSIECNKEIKGLFPSGVIQYVFTYYNKYGAESNIFYHSPLYYSHMYNRGGSPEEIASNSFNINVSNLDKKFDFVRVYSIIRSSIDATPVVKKVIDLNIIEDNISFTDSNTTGETIDPTILLYLGGENIIPECITHKDNTLFLGNYKLKQSTFSSYKYEDTNNIKFFNRDTPKYENRSGYYSYETQLNLSSYDITTLKSKESYRFGIQFQNEIGRWSEVLWVGDKTVDKNPSLYIPVNISQITDKMSSSLVKASYTIPKTLLEEAHKLGYIKARGVIVYPSNVDKNVICQGILNPTVYKYDDRYTEGGGISNSPYSQSSWFFRPYVKDRMYSGIDHIYGSVANYTDYRSVNYTKSEWGLSRSTEIGTTLSYVDENNKTIDRDFYVDANIVTMHSPDIEFLDSIEGFQDSNLKCRIVGYVNIDNCKSFRDVQAETISADVNDYGFYDKFPSNLNNISTPNTRGGILISGINWIGKAIKKDKDTWKATDVTFGWLVSPWQRSGSLINDFAKRPDSQVISKLKSNKLINTRISYSTIFKNNWTPPNGISKISVFNSNEQEMLFIGDTDKVYYGNIDKLLIPGSKTYNEGAEIGYTRNYSLSRSINEDNNVDSSPEDGDLGGGESSRPTINNLYSSAIFSFSGNNNVTDDDYLYSRNPVSMKYKSTKHVVFQFINNGNKRVLLPAITKGMYEHSVDNAYYDTFDIEHDAILWLAELYRDEVPNKFGGTSESALLNNKWNIAGDSVFISENGELKDSVEIEYLQGDTYFQRYDCLKTYPYTLEDENSIVDILSFYCETRVNLDGRYDRNRKNFNNLSITPSIFNLINPVYSQSNNFFNYHILDSSMHIDNFKNSLTWSKEKHLGEDIDQWTNITLASTLDLDGDKGEITALRTFNNEIFCFQKQGLSNILFNSRIQIPTSDGSPIEITNGLKVSGKRYISSIGCNNKWSIAESPSGLYFIDNTTNGIYLFNGQIQSLSDNLGLSKWVGDNSTFKTWNPKSFENFKTHYDKNNGDVYFINKDYCLCYTESIQQFTSFMSYEATPYMFNVNDKFISIKDNKLWNQFKGEYNNIYNEIRPYSITFISNPDVFYDKIFNTIEYRADLWDNNTLLNKSPFDTLEVWNEYQRGIEHLEFKQYVPSNLKRKFRVWRANVPRDMSNNRDRIRNTWAFFKLSNTKPNTYKTEFHDSIISYFI